MLAQDSHVEHQGEPLIFIDPSAENLLRLTLNTSQNYLC